MEKYSNVPAKKLAALGAEYFEFETEEEAHQFLDLLTANGWHDYGSVQPRLEKNYPWEDRMADAWIVDIFPEHAHQRDAMYQLTEQMD